ncbi:conserved hypothetical protein [Bathymodiolus platifrons methanotrophic gill symbiont]|uniref:PaaI family thioesterase n=1 Tax=Bathymodiolus platifrons methanotrophic gill symbiont TaxID=113268 RepID=UPI000B41D62D|nr:DUF4442 domain-containing protein [Bathymodiolus platifrons methanotrophic gill symbiont]MCK5869400.1 DUF4442 domain-containing protein [Methyloprofundus sp.]TXK97809.1 DUF4442 domain-containing protein [Methylococcaceae bacterium CS4]TXL00396.1 DUF4442 domain-containing protein [Methylococcaceae bacterium CS5]TXL02059.1 DUF4442 domain-containing protein [Methylococcaceae bacterium HT1]TXL03474.1 DUF4442 domain-containing protein [Methylococcaceae bacterium CS3]TXL08055.1 DUF4442 domain-co
MNLRRLIWNTSLISDKKRIEWFPAFWLMRIKVLDLSSDWRHIKIRLPHSWIATNIGGSLFGGFQACLADPIAAMACMKIFPGYAVWTRSLQLDFREQGLTDLELRFHISPETEQKIRTDLANKGRSTPLFEYGYYQADGSLCTVIQTRVAIRPAGYKKLR